MVLHALRRTSWVCGLWLCAFLAPAALVPAWGQDHYEAVLEAMQPPIVPGPVITNRIAPPDWGRVPPLPPKTRVTAAVAAQATAAPPPPGVPAPGLGPVPAPGDVAPPGTEPALPLANPEQVRIKANSLYQTEGATAAQGDVELRYQDITVKSQAAELDADRIWGTFSGDVDLTAKLYKAQASRLRINLESEEFQGASVAAEVQPEFFESEWVLLPLYVRADEVVGRPQRIEGSQGVGTSCDIWPDPHWMLRSRRITVIPDNKVTFEKPTLYMFGRRLIRFPWDLTLSLRRRENRFLPEVGQNEVEGYYAKFAYGYLLDEANSGFLRLHLTQKRGVGLGFDHLLEQARQTAELSFFTEPSQGGMSGRLMHRAQLSRPFNTNLNVSFQDNSGYGQSSESLNGDLALRYDTATSQSMLGFQQSTLSSDFSSSNRFASSLEHRQRMGTTGDWSVLTSYHRSGFGTQTADDEELETELAWRQQYRAFDVNFLAQKRYDIDGSRYLGDEGFFSLNRTPDIAIRTETERLGGFRLLGSQFAGTLYLGRFEQEPDSLKIYRSGIDLQLPGHLREWGDSTLQTSGRFRQMFYSEGSAQWIGEFRSELRRQLSNSWESRLSFNYMRPNGFSPLRQDFSSPTSIAYLQLVRLVPEKMRLDFNFGRDFHNNYFHDAIFRGELMLSPRNRLEMQAGFSVEQSSWRPLNLRWIYATERTWWSALTVNYDLDNSDLTNLSMDLDWTPSLKWRVQFLGGYSSFGGFDQADLRITRDLHCMLASLTYIQQTGEIRLGLGIKAFPSATRTFGVGQRGQYFESNFGDQY